MSERQDITHFVVNDSRPITVEQLVLGYLNRNAMCPIEWTVVEALVDC